MARTSPVVTAFLSRRLAPGERARRKEMLQFTASRIAQAMQPVSCSCVRDVLAERARQR